MPLDHEQGQEEPSMECSTFFGDPEVLGVLDHLKTTCAGKIFSDIVDDDGASLLSHNRHLD